MLILALLILTALVSFLLSIIILQASTKNRLNIYLAGATIFITVWAIGDAIMLYTNSLTSIHVGIDLFYAGPMLTALFMLFFSYASPTGQRVNKTFAILMSVVALSFFAFIVVDPHYLVHDVLVHQHSHTVRNVIIPNKRPYMIYALYFDIYFALSYVFLIKRYRSNVGLYKTQMLIIMVGIALSSGLAVTTNLIFPVEGIYDKVWMGPIFTLIFAALLTFAIIKHRYLDIKAFAARATAYTLMVAVIAASYAVTFSLATQVLLVNHALTSQQQILSVLLALFFATSFAPLKRMLDRITNRIFFRNAYDPQTLLNNLGKIMSGEIELERLTSKVISELTLQMKLSKALIVVMDNDKIFYEANTATIKNQTIGPEELKVLGSGVVTKNALDPTKIPKMFEDYDLSASVDLLSNNELVGYLLLGDKKNGDIYTKSDIKTLSILAHELAIAIHNAKSYTQIQNFNRTLQKRIDDATAQLRDANERLKKLDGIKNEFLSMATHQLNTPLSVIDGYLSMIIDNANTRHDIPDDDREFLQKSLHRVHLMKRLVTDFLNVSRIETGTYAIEVEPVDMNRLVTEEVNTLGLAAKERQVLLRYYAPQHPLPVLEIDEQKTRQAVMNLIDNAIFYTPKGDVKVYLDSDGQNVTFKVVDDGIGVPADQKSMLFKKFSRASNAINQRPSGTGVGLYLVKRVVEDQGGKIIFQSTEGKGSTFGFTLPIKKGEEAAAKPSMPELTSTKI